MERMNHLSPLITIDRLNLQLPHGFEHRADTIARRVGDELARLSWSGMYELKHVLLPSLTVRPEQSDHQIAALIARSIHSQITGGKN